MLTTSRTARPESPRAGRLVPTDPDTAAVAAEARCPKCGHRGLTATSWLVAGELDEWLGCPECYAIQSI